MAERACVLESKAYLTLNNFYNNQKAALKELKKAGKKLCWMFGDDVPEEIILAAGMIPVRLTGEYETSELADKYLEISFGSFWKAAFEKLLRASEDGLVDYLVLSNSSDIIQRMYYYLMQLKRIEPERNIPEMYYIDYSLLVKDFSAQERNIAETKDFIKKIEQWSGEKISKADLTGACEICNRHRDALRKISDLRKKGKILASESLSIIVGSFFTVKETSIKLLNEIALEAENWPISEMHKIAYTGSMQEKQDLYNLLEECGLNVIADDKLLGDRYSDRNIDMALSPEIGITLRYHLRFPSSERAYVNERAKVIPEMVKESGSKGLLIFMNHNDESYIWDFPKQKIVLQEMGIKSLMIEDQYFPLRDINSIREKMLGFASGLEMSDNG